MEPTWWVEIRDFLRRLGGQTLAAALGPYPADRDDRLERLELVASKAAKVPFGWPTDGRAVEGLSAEVAREAIRMFAAQLVWPEDHPAEMSEDELAHVRVWRNRLGYHVEATRERREHAKMGFADGVAAERQRMLDVLNEIAATDPHALTELIDQRVICGVALATHPTVQVGHVDPRDLDSPFELGVMGILNGLLGDPFDGWLAATYNDADEVLRFGLIDGHGNPVGTPTKPRRYAWRWFNGSEGKRAWELYGEDSEELVTGVIHRAFIWWDSEACPWAWEAHGHQVNHESAEEWADRADAARALLAFLRIHPSHVSALPDEDS